MSYTIEAPVTVSDGGVGRTDDTVTTHPCFAQISCSRISGWAQLYDSDFQHQHYMMVRINRSQLHRGLSRDWHFEREEYIEVAMSESQWATFISTPNSSGTPCTLQHLNGDHIPQLPKPEKRTDQFRKEAFKTMQSSLSDLAKLETMINEAGLSSKKSDALLKQVQFAKSGITNSVGFVMDQFGEHMETTVDRAKTEVSAYASAAIHRAGLQALAGEAPILTYEPETTHANPFRETKK